MLVFLSFKRSFTIPGTILVLARVTVAKGEDKANVHTIMGCCATRSDFFVLGYLFPGAATCQIPGIKTKPPYAYHVLNYAEHDGDLTFS